MDSFWKPWKDTKQIKWMASVLTFAFVMTLLGLYVTFQDDPQQQAMALIYLIMLIWGSMFGIMDWSRKTQTGLATSEFVYFGSMNRFLVSGLVGVLFALFISGSLFTSAPLAVPVIGGVSLAFFYVVLVAPYAEEKFFASTVAPTSYKLFGGLLGLVITAGFFGVYHGFAYGWNENLMMVAVIWRAAVLIGNQFFKSTGFSYLAHMANNYIVYTAMAGG